MDKYEIVPFDGDAERPGYVLKNGKSINVCGLLADIKALQAHVERLRNTLRHLLPFGRSEGDSFFDYNEGSEEIGQHVADSYYATPKQSVSELKAQAVEQAAEVTKLVASIGADPDLCRYSDLLNEANNFRKHGEL